MEKIYKRYWVEPAHPMVIKLHDDLVEIYRFLKENYQKEIDTAFDNAAKKIGFVVTTTMPISLEFGTKGNLNEIKIGSEKLGETILVDALSSVLNIDRIKEDIKKEEIEKPKVSPGVYNLALLWFDAVKLSLRTDWMEPAQPVYRLQSQLMGNEIPQDIKAEMQLESLSHVEPAHYMEPVHTPCRYVCYWKRECRWDCPPWWLEPAHSQSIDPLYASSESAAAQPVFQKDARIKKIDVKKIYEPNEPVQWQDRANLISMERAVLISVIDEVYPELELGKRLSEAQYTLNIPESIEPAHEALRMSKSGIQFIPDIREPAHLKIPQKEDLNNILSELATLLKKYGY